MAEFEKINSNFERSLIVSEMQSDSTAYYREIFCETFNWCSKFYWSYFKKLATPTFNNHPDQSAAINIEARLFPQKIMVYWTLRWWLGFSGGTVIKNSLAKTGDARDTDSVLVLGRSPGVGNGNLLQYSCLENSIAEEPDELQSMESQGVIHGWMTGAHAHTHTHTHDDYQFLAIKYFYFSTFSYICTAF